MGNPPRAGREQKVVETHRNLSHDNGGCKIAGARGLDRAPTSEEGLDGGEGAQPKRLTDTERLGYDAVSLPQHYKAFPVEPIRFCQENKLSFLQSSIIKYVVRYNLKNGIEDLKKCSRCLDMLIAFEEGDPDWWKLPGERASRRTYIV